MNRNEILFLSNSYGEDVAAARIARNLKERASDRYEVAGASLMGGGSAYVRQEIPSIYQGKVSPSGGFPTRSVGNFFKDLFSSSLFNPFRYVSALKKWREKTALGVVVGDVFLLYLARRGLGKDVPLVFFSIYKSEVSDKHFSIEKNFMRKNVKLVITRDQPTAEILKQEGLDAVFLGNPVVEEMTPTGTDIGLTKGNPTVALLPGSRSEAYEGLRQMLEVAEETYRQLHPSGLFKEYEPFTAVNFVAAISETLDMGKLLAAANRAGWRFSRTEGDLTFVEKEDSRAVLVGGHFADVIDRADVVLSLAGTATEQAAAKGKPTLGFAGAKMLATSAWLERQGRLLGENFKTITGKFPQEIAKEILFLLHNPKERERRGKIGKDIMGPPNASERIVDLIGEKFGLNPSEKNVSSV